MIYFIIKKLKSLFSFSHLLVLFVYTSITWFLVQPSFNPTSIYSSASITTIYGNVLMSITFLNFLLFVIKDFKSEITSNMKEILLTRLNSKRYIYGLFTAYFLFFIIGFVIPTYCIALFQQFYYASNTIKTSFFILKVLSLIISFVPLWIIITLYFVSVFRNEFVTLFLITVVYFFSLPVQVILKGVLFNNFWLMTFFEAGGIKSYLPIFTWFLSLSILPIIVKVLTVKISVIGLKEKFGKGLLASITKKLKFYLSMYHYRMLGLAPQIILWFFSFIGLIFVIILLNNPNGNFIVLSKIYIGAFIPVLFSFNQYSLIQIDREAGMMQTIFLRKISYSRIILNRWLIILIPQLFVVLIFVLLINIFGKPFSIEFIFYILLLNAFTGLLNLFIAIIFQSSGLPNLFIFALVYLQLRADVQLIITSSPVLNSLNIFYPLLQQKNVKIFFSHWITLLFFIFFLIIGITYTLKKRDKYITKF